jgi:hypothetical protein
MFDPVDAMMSRGATLAPGVQAGGTEALLAAPLSPEQAQALSRLGAAGRLSLHAAHPAYVSDLPAALDAVVADRRVVAAIDTRLDDRLYSVAAAFWRHAGFGVESAELRRSLDALTPRLVDRLVHELRWLHHAVQADVEAAGRKVLVADGDPRGLHAALGPGWRLMDADGGLGGLPAIALEDAERQRAFRLATPVYGTPEPAIPLAVDTALGAVGGADLLIFHGGDLQYADVARGLLAADGERRLFALSLSEPAEADGWPAPEAFAVARQDARAAVSADEIGALDEAMRAAPTTLIAHEEDPLVRLVGPAAARTFPAVLQDLSHQRAFAASFARLLSGGGVHSVIVSPGRTAEARTAVALAQAAGLPTFDVQGGVIAINGRFFAPRAHTCFCLDPGAARAYAQHFSVPAHRIRVTGSPRLDLRLAPSRGRSRAAARERLAVVTGDPTERPLIYFASQPVDEATALALADLLLDGVARLNRPDVLTLIGLHPNEPPARANLYEQAAAARGLRIVVAQGLAPHDAIQGADAVLTFFSTVGLEARALGRPVGALNPFATAAPYDLVAAAEAALIRSPDECAAFLTRALAEAGDLAPPEHLDGHAAERIVAKISAAAP